MGVLFPLCDECYSAMEGERQRRMEPKTNEHASMIEAAKREDVLKWSFTKAQWSIRARKAIVRAVHGTPLHLWRENGSPQITFADICRLTQEQLLAQKNVGEMTVREIEGKIEELGLSLSQEASS